MTPEREQEFEAETLTALNDLRRALANAQRAIYLAAGHLALLAGAELHHPDYAESSEGADMTVFLREAARAVRAATALNPDSD